MASDTQIANLALTKLGEPNPLLALTDDTNAGRVMNRLFTLVRDAELRRNRWKFAITRTTLSALAAAPTGEDYDFQYPIPADFIALIQVGDVYVRPADKRKPLWSIESGHILTNMPAPLFFRYVKRETNAGLFDPLFVEMMACKLAYESCEQLTNSNTKKQSIGQDYKSALLEAARCDAIENPPDEMPWGSWLESREGLAYSLSGSAGGTLYSSGSVVV